MRASRHDELPRCHTAPGAGGTVVMVMSIERVERGADSPLVERITRVRYPRTVEDWTLPDGCWDIVIRRVRGRIQVLQTGLITQPIRLDYEAGDEYLCVSFKPGVYMPRLPGSRMVNRGLLRPTVGRRSFWLDGDTLEIPTFANAEGLVARLARRQVITRDELVARCVEGHAPAMSPRSVQRRFQQVLGITAKSLTQIQRAQRAVEILRSGRSVVDVAHEVGFADQAHLTRSLRRWLGTTPGGVARARTPH